MSRATRQLRRPAPQLRAHLLERAYDRLIHRRRRYRGEELDDDSAALLRADAFEPGREGPDRLADHRLIEVADFEREQRATGNDIDAPGIKAHRTDIGRGLGVHALYEIAQLGRGTRGGAPRIMAQPEGGGPRVVLRSLDLDPLAVDADDAGDHREVDFVRLHARALLDVELEKCLDRIAMLLRLQHPVEVAASRGQHLTDGDPLPTEPIAQPLDVQLPRKCQAADQARLETHTLLVRKTDDLQLLGQRIR